MFNEIYLEGPGSTDRVPLPDKLMRCARYRHFGSRITIANPEYMFNFHITIFDEAVISSLMSFANHPYTVGVVDETVAA
jgi:hypothetical protein